MMHPASLGREWWFLHTPGPSEANSGMQVKTILNRIQKHRGFVHGTVQLEEQIAGLAKKAKAGSLLYKEPPLAIRLLRFCALIATYGLVCLLLFIFGLDRSKPVQEGERQHYSFFRSIRQIGSASVLPRLLAISLISRSRDTGTVTRWRRPRRPGSSPPWRRAPARGRCSGGRSRQPPKGSPPPDAGRRRSPPAALGCRRRRRAGSRPPLARRLAASPSGGRSAPRRWQSRPG